MAEEESLADNIRELLGPLVGLTIVDITQEDWDEVCRKYPDPEERESSIFLHMSDGTTLAVKVGGSAGFCYPFESEDESGYYERPGFK